MVLYRAIQKIAYPKKKISMPRYRNPVQYLLSDTSRRRRRGKGRRSFAPTHPLKRHEVTTNLESISTTAQVLPLNNIAQGTGTDSERTEQRIKALTLSVNTTVLWDDGGGGNDTRNVRIIVASVSDAFSPTSPNIYTTSNIFDKRDFPEIGHVYKDFRVTKMATTSLGRKVSFKVPIYRTFKYDGDAATDYQQSGYNRLVLIAIGDYATPTDTNFNQTRVTLRYHG